MRGHRTSLQGWQRFTLPNSLLTVFQSITVTRWMNISGREQQQTRAKPQVKVKGLMRVSTDLASYQNTH